MRFLKFSILFLFFAFSSSINKPQLNDAEILIHVLSTKEGTIDIHTSKDSLELQFEKLRENLNTKQSYIELYKQFSSTISKIQCGHTQLFPSKKVFKEWVLDRNSLPIDYILVGKQLFVNESIAEDEKIVNADKPKKQFNCIPKNSEIISIDHQTVPELMEKMGKYISSDEDGIDFKYFQATQLFEFYRCLIADKKDSVEVLYSEKRDTLKMYLFTGIPPIKTINKRLKEHFVNENKKQKDIGKFTVLKNKYANFKFVSFNDCRGKKYEKFLKESFEEIQKKKLTKMIVDLRGNNGGQMQFSFMRYLLGSKVYLGKYLVKKPFKRFHNQHIRKFNKEYRNHKRLTRIQKRLKRRKSDYDGQIFTRDVDEKLIFKGDIIVITDEGSFSAASILACHLKTLLKAKIVGQPAGGSFYIGNAGTLQVKLPYTNFKMTVNPNTFSTQLERNNNPQQIKQPDLLLTPITPKMNKKDDWYINKACKAFK